MSIQSIAWQLMSEEDYGNYIEEKMMDRPENSFWLLGTLINLDGADPLGALYDKIDKSEGLPNDLKMISDVLAAELVAAYMMAKEVKNHE